MSHPMLDPYRTLFYWKDPQLKRAPQTLLYKQADLRDVTGSSGRTPEECAEERADTQGADRDARTQPP